MRNAENTKITVNIGGGEVKTNRSEYDPHEWELTVEGRDVNEEYVQANQTIDVKEGLKEVVKWIKHNDIMEVKIPLQREMGGEFSRIQQSRWHKQVIRDLMQTGVKMEIVVRDNEEKLWTQDQILGLSSEE